MRVLHTATGKYKDAMISLLQPGELTNTVKSRFDFDWEKELYYDVYKITIINENSILGLMSLVNIEDELRLQIKLLESARENKGRDKVYGLIAGNLIAYACQLAFDNGFGGFVSLIPKTNLITYYITKYHFSPYGTHLRVAGDVSKALITEYLEND